MWPVEDLIVAPATPPGAGARAIVRIAGDGLDTLLPTLFDAADPRGFARRGHPSRCVAARLAATGLARDWGAVPVTILHWPGPRGPVGGPLAEVQLPGSAPLVAAVVAEACRHGARLARGGEFTLRAFLAGRLDLVQAEAVLGVIDARTPGELTAALDRMAGGAGAAVGHARSAILDLLADVEAALDFADETAPDATPADDASRRGWIERLEWLRADLSVVAADLSRRDAGAHGGLPRVVLAGRPNVGKSSLFNVLVGRDAAIVADETGTTRDRLEAPLAGDDGPACVVVDLAGVSDGASSADHVAAAAADVARAEIARADVVVACRDAADAASPGTAVREGVPRVDVVTRCDRAAGATDASSGEIRTSVLDGRGLDDLRAAIRAAVAALPPRSPATLRMAAGVEASAAALAAAAAALGPLGVGDEAVAAGHLRGAVAALDEVTGAALGSDLLDRIFSRHCVGK